MDSRNSRSAAPVHPALFRSAAAGHVGRIGMQRGGAALIPALSWTGLMHKLRRAGRDRKGQANATTTANAAETVMESPCL
jgi:hypothetical protein